MQKFVTEAGEIVFRQDRYKGTQVPKTGPRLPDPPICLNCGSQSMIRNWTFRYAHCKRCDHVQDWKSEDAERQTRLLEFTDAYPRITFDRIPPEIY